ICRLTLWRSNWQRSAIRELQGTRIEKCPFRDVSPAQSRRSEVEEAFVYSSRQIVLATYLDENLAAELTERLQDSVIDFADLDCRILHQRPERACVVGIEFRKRAIVLRRSGAFDDAALGAAQAVPKLFADSKGNRSSRLVEAGIVVKLGRFVQPQSHVQPGADEFTRINGARLQRRDNLARWQGHHDSAEALQHLAAWAGHAVAQTLECLDTGELFCEPAAHLRAGIATEERLEAETRTQLVPKCLASTEIDPCIDFAGRKAEWD